MQLIVERVSRDWVDRRARAVFATGMGLASAIFASIAWATISIETARTPPSDEIPLTDEMPPSDEIIVETSPAEASGAFALASRLVADRFAPWYWRRYGALYRPFDRPVSTPELFARAAECDLSEVAVAAFVASPGALAKVRSKGQGKERAIVHIELYDPITNLLVRAGSRDGAARERADRIQRALEQVVAHGEAAIPHMRHFLTMNRDIDFKQGIDESVQLPFGSLRLAVFEALSQIGGEAAAAVLLRELQSTSEPDEIARLAILLDEQSPGKYREEVARAARETMAMAWQSQQLDRSDTMTLLSLIEKDKLRAVAELAKAR